MRKGSRGRDWLPASKYQTWALINLHPGKKAGGCRWVFKTKCDTEGEIQKYKARLVAKGYDHKYAEDYNGTFAPIVRRTSVRILLSIAATKKMNVKHLDIKNAFLYGQIKEAVYSKQPWGFEQLSDRNLVCKLQKTISGLRQATRCWNEKLYQMLTK